MEGGIVNKVAESGIVSLDLTDLIPVYTVKDIDLKNRLWQGLVLREADFREWIKTEDFSPYTDAVVGIHCSVDALIPHWAYMLLASKLEEVARFIAEGTAVEAERAYIHLVIQSIHPENYTDQRVVVKGCGDRDLPAAAYIALTTRLQPVVKTLMFGEPCSTVPIYKQKRKA